MAKGVKKSIVRESISGVDRPDGSADAMGLISRDAFGSLESSPLEDILFVKNNYLIKELTASECPSPVAWAYIQMIRSEKAESECGRSATEQELLLKIIPRMLPTKNQMDAQQAFRDMGQSCKETIQKIQAKRKADKENIKGHPKAAWTTDFTE